MENLFSFQLYKKCIIIINSLYIFCSCFFFRIKSKLHFFDSFRMLRHKFFHRAKKVPVTEQELRAKLKKKEKKDDKKPDDKKKKEEEAAESSHAEGKEIQPQVKK